MMSGFNAINVKAGSINSNEAGVISAAGSTFEYNGGYYVAQPVYMEKLRNRLMQDDTDLDAQQASAAIAAIYDNVETGIEKGYIVLVGSVSDYATEVTAAPVEEPVQTEETSESEKKDKKNKDKKNKDKKDDSSKNDDESDNPKDIDDNIDAIVSATQAPVPTSKAELETYIDPESDMKVIDNEVNELDIAGSDYQFETSVPVTLAAATGSYKFDIDTDAATKKIESLKQTEPGEVIESIQNDFVIPIFKKLVVIAGILLIILIIYIVIKKKFNFPKIIVSVLGAVFIFSGVTMLSVSILGAYCFSSKDVLISDIARERYYNKVYDSLSSNVGEVLTAAGFEDDVLNGLINERNVYISGKLTIEAAFNEKRNTDFLDVENTVYEILSHDIANRGFYYTQTVKDNTTTVAGLIQSLYGNSLRFTYANELSERIDSMRKNLVIAAVAGFVLMLLGILILLFTQKYIHRITRLAGFALLISSFSNCVSVLIYKFRGSVKNLKLNPGDYKDFFTYYINHAQTFAIAFSCILVLISIGLLVITFLLKSTNKTNRFVKVRL